jgi:hypothetical protein
MARAAQKSRSNKKTQTSKISLGHLRLYNFIAALLLALQGILVLILSDPHKGLHPITASFLTRDQVASTIAGHSVLSAASHHLFDLNIAYLVAAFLFMGALGHLLISTFKHKSYESELNKGVNRYHWIEYALSGGAMMLAVALLAGVLDIASLIMIFVLTAIASLLGMAMELRNQGANKTDWTNYTIGVAAGLAPWIIVLIYIWYAHVYGSGVPGFVYWAYGTMLILFAGFAINMYFQYKKLGHWAKPRFAQLVYIALGFVAKTVLAWQIFAGTLK